MERDRRSRRFAYQRLARERIGLLRALTDAALLAEPSGRVAGLNSAAAQLLATPERQTIGRDLEELLPGLRATAQWRRFCQTNRTPAERGQAELVELVVGDGVGEDSTVEISVSRLDDTIEADSAILLVLRAGRRRRRETETQALLAEASAVLEHSLDDKRALEQIARVAVPEFADLCLIDLQESDGSIRRIGSAGSEESIGQIAPQFALHPARAPGESAPTLLVIRSGEPLLAPEAGAGEQFVDTGTAVPSYLVVPVPSQRGTLGAVAFVSNRPGRRYGHADIPFASDLARRAALALVNAQLYRATRRAESEARARAEELERVGSELRQSESRFRALTASLVEAVYEADVHTPDHASGLFRYWSDNVATVLGYPPEAFFRNDSLWEESVHPDDRERALAAWYALIDRDETLDMEYRFIKPGGEVVWIEDRARVERGALGEALFVHGTNADVTARKRMEEQLQLSAREAGALYRAALAVGGELELEAQLERLLDAARELVGAQRAAVALIDQEREEVQTVAARGLSMRASRLRLPIHGSLLGLVVTSGQPIRTGSAPHDPRTWNPEQLRNEGVFSWLGVPLEDRAGVFGVLSVVSADEDRFGAEHERLLASLASLVGWAVRQARLRSEAQRLAVVEERTRLARELHDSVTQSLFSASMLAQAAQTLWKRDPEKAKDRLDRATELCGGALAEMRALIFELRPEALQEESLVAALQKHAEARQARDGLRVEIIAQDERRLRPVCEEAVYRIVREALHNVAKHASAHEVLVRLDFGDDQLVIEVRDDGRGFDPSAGIGRGLGLTSMRERAEQLGGRVVVQSSPGAGTTIRADIPIAAPEATAESPEAMPDL